MKSNFLPDEVVAEILYKLPIKSILRCTCVCKSWYSLIKNSNFISAHLQKTSNNSSNHYFLFKSDQYHNRYFLCPDNENFSSYMPLQLPFHPRDNFLVAGSCNGLICLYAFKRENRYECRVFLWNPLIGKSLSIDFNSKIELTLYSTFVGFGYDSRTHDYKVLSICRCRDTNSDFKAELYSLNLNSWKDITHITPNCKYDVPYSAFVNGALHVTATGWENYDKQWIMVFDMSDEAFHEIGLPECIESFLPAVNVYEESSIAVIDKISYDEYHIWVMKEYGVVSSWMKLAMVSNLWSGAQFSEVLGLRNNGEVLIAAYEDMLTHTKERDGWLIIGSRKLNSQQTEILMNIPDDIERFFAYSYVGSLVLLDKENGGDESDAEHPTGFITSIFY